MKNRQTQTEKLVKYVAEMECRRDEYDHDALRILEELEEKDSQTAEELREVYDSLSERICMTCKERKMFDGDNEEFYCPVHD